LYEIISFSYGILFQKFFKKTAFFKVFIQKNHKNSLFLSKVSQIHQKMSHFFEEMTDFYIRNESFLEKKQSFLEKKQSFFETKQ
jgi:CMP-N-acetylneuraminic acid synthetase